jgi:hypothetical protein
MPVTGVLPVPSGPAALTGLPSQAICDPTTARALPVLTGAGQARTRMVSRATTATGLTNGASKAATTAGTGVR